MKSLFILLALFGGASAAHAQLLPVPGAKNPDWKTEKSEAQPSATPFDEPLKTDRMPNAMQNSIVSKGNQHRYWDADRQLAYTWQSRPNSGTVAPDQEVLVREDRTGITYTFRRKR
ncbi:hypothetical protein Q5H92_09430 [Hymenobacter sp. M29]|uniref:Lipocalin-like domain-containing protein n=1 Tax=Hymenobacter mellowenesis TaxID=3063995 RepID=A0ABT9AC52_9BACT|nr:hypothetical protein [Hymenobacter sp. M29]MDO7846576.1 hypothetical protein [Hymenobacter sp. M29]